MLHREASKSVVAGAWATQIGVETHPQFGDQDLYKLVCQCLQVGVVYASDMFFAWWKSFGYWFCRERGAQVRHGPPFLSFLGVGAKVEIGWRKESSELIARDWTYRGRGVHCQFVKVASKLLRGGYGSWVLIKTSFYKPWKVDIC